uniref:NAD(P)/FAD-dependent oxidoreductase n=1 Tax=Methanoculleus chikugoensis TaxID=118126 RepID=UPI000A4FF168
LRLRPGPRAAGNRGCPRRLPPVYVEDYPFADLAGISFQNLTLSVYRDGKRARQRTGDLLFTHAGLSGPGILDLSRAVLPPGDVLRVTFLTGGARRRCESASPMRSRRAGPGR